MSTIVFDTKMSSASFRVSVAKAFDKIPKHVSTLNGLPQPKLTREHCDFFHTNGFIVFKNFLNPQLIPTLQSRVVPVFEGDFDTGVYPDEWYGGRNMSYPHITREICNVWKSDTTIAQIVLSSQIHNMAVQLMNYNSSKSNTSDNHNDDDIIDSNYNYGSRIGQDDLLWKPKQCGTALGFHQDCTYISDQFEFISDRINNVNDKKSENFEPLTSVTIWLPFDDVSIRNGSIEYVKGSHKWDNSNFNLQVSEFGFHDSGPMEGKEDVSKTIGGDTDKHRKDFIKMAERCYGREEGEEYEFVSVEIPKGGVAIHHENMWHGSGMNIDNNNERRVIAVHTLNNACQFNSDRIKNNKIGYIYGKYPMYDTEKESFSCQLNETYFPVCFGGTQSKRSKWLNNLVKDIDVLA